MGLLQRELAAQLGVNKTTVSLWERNRTTPALRHWARILAYLGCFPDEGSVGLPDRLKAYRRATGLTQADLARALGVVECTVRGWESGAHAPRRDHCVKLRTFLDESIRLP